MPNWTFCDMHCDTPEMWSRVVPFLTGVNDYGEECELTFNNVVPMPQYVYTGDLGREEEIRFGTDNCWYCWSLKHWGCKWDASEVNMGESGCTFETPWSPPAAWFVALAEALGNLDPGIKVTVKCDVEGDGWIDYQITGGEVTITGSGDEDRWEEVKE